MQSGAASSFDRLRTNGLIGLAGLLLAGPAFAQELATDAPKPADAAAKPKPAAPPAAKPVAQPTPMADRVVRFAVLDKQNGKARDFLAHPGQVVTTGRLTIHVRACEATPPWDRPWSGAFLQVDEQPRRAAQRRIFSGWLFAESPSINALQHQYYDVWVKSCTMRFPDVGPDTMVVGKAAPKASSAPKSPATPSAAPSIPR